MPIGLPVHMEKAFKNEFGKTYCKLTAHRSQRALVMKWYGYTTNKQIEEVTKWVAELRMSFPFDTLVNDCTYIISMWQDSLEWFSKVWLIKMENLHVTRFIHVAKPNSFGDKIGQHLAFIKEANMEFLFFVSNQELADWLNPHDKEDIIPVN